MRSAICLGTRMSPNRAPRIAGYAYQGFARYFLTTCVFPRRPVFLDLGAGRWVVSELLRAAEDHDFSITAYCVMPDHVHVLAEASRDDAGLVKFVSAWKQRTGFHWKRRTQANLWQQGFFDHVLRDDEAEIQIVKYIVENPVRAGLVIEPADYPLTGSSKYTFEQLTEVLVNWSPGWRNDVWRG